MYATAGDTDGEYATSGFGYTYNDVEASIIEAFGDVATMRVNHHGSSHSSSQAYVDGMAPETAVIQCGSNSYGHPANRVLDVLRQVVNSDGVGADIYLTNNPCDTDESDGTPIDYTGTFNTDGDIWLRTTGGGTGYDVTYDAGTNVYAAAPPPSGVRIAEARFRGPGGASDEFIELVNVGSEAVDVSGWALQGCAATSGSPATRATVPSGTSLAGGQRYLIANNGYGGTVVPDLTYSTGIADTGGARIIDAAGAIVDGVGSSDGTDDQCREGAGLAFPTSDQDVSYHRLDEGRTDIDDNSSDFEGPSASSPQNSSGGSTGGTGGTGGTVADLVINEYVADNASFPAEWVELYNPTSGDVDASGLWIDDIANGGSSPQQLPSGSIVPAGGHLVFEFSGFVLNNTGDDVRLVTADQATVIDAHSYTSSADDLSYRRSPDGGAWCANDGPATQGTSNPSSCP